MTNILAFPIHVPLGAYLSLGASYTGTAQDGAHLWNTRRRTSGTSPEGMQAGTRRDALKTFADPRNGVFFVFKAITELHIFSIEFH